MQKNIIPRSQYIKNLGIFSGFLLYYSLGLMLTINNGHRPVQVMGRMTSPGSRMHKLGALDGASAALEMVTLDNGAICKRIHGHLKREPGSVNYEVCGAKSMMEIT